MRLVDINGNDIDEAQCDLTKGYIREVTIVKSDAEPIDEKTKFVWADEDWEHVRMYTPYPALPEQGPTAEDRISALEEAMLELIIGGGSDG